MKGFTIYAILAAIGNANASVIKTYETRGSLTLTDANYQNLKFYVQHSGAAFCNFNRKVGDRVQCAGNCPGIEANSATILTSFVGDLTGVGGYVALDTRRQEIVASFRGSSNIRNFITDIRFNLASCSNIVKDCQVHDGFADGWSEISGKVFAAVKAASEANPGYKIVATGHSLGAAIATLGAAYLRQVGYDVDLYTYGSPRVGNDAFANFITQSRGGQWRVTHRDDPVPRLPPLFTGYRHISPEYWLKGGNTDQIEYPITSIMQCDGIANINCNAGTFGLNTEAHGYYFRKVGACSTTGGLQWKRSELDPTHKELELRLNVWSQKDQEMFKNY